MMAEFIFMAWLGYVGVMVLVGLMRLTEMLVESLLPCPPPRSGRFVTLWVYDDEEFIIRLR